MDSRVQSPASVGYRYKHAQNIRPHWYAMCDSDTLQFVQQYSNAIGCLEEQIYFPLLAMSSSMMAPSSVIEITDEWVECPALWFAVASRRGAGKTAILNLLKRSLTHDPDLNVVNEVCFNTDNLARRPERRHLALFEDISAMTECTTRTSELILASMYSGRCPLDDRVQTTLSATGFIHPRDLVTSFARDEIQPISNRFLYVCPQERDCFMEDLTPVHKSTPRIEDVLQIIAEAHQKPLVYHFNPQAKDMVNEYLNELTMHRRSVTDDENKRYVLSSARAQFCRLALVGHVFRGAVKEAMNRIDGNCDDQWLSNIIKVESVRCARECMNYLLDTKLNLLPPSGEMESRSEKSGENSPKSEPTWRPLQREMYFNGDEVHNAREEAERERERQSVFPTSSALHQSIPSFPFAYSSPTMVPTMSHLPPSSLFPFPRTPERLQFPQPPSSGNRPSPYINCRQRTPVVQGVEMNGSFHYDFSNLLPWAAKNLRSLLTSGHPEISASIVAGRHLMPPTKTPGTENRYKTGAAIAYLYSVADLGFGSIYRTNKRSVVFKKFPFEQLSQNAKDILTKIQVTEEAYSRIKMTMMDDKTSIKKSEEVMSSPLSMPSPLSQSQIQSPINTSHLMDVPMDLALRNGGKITDTGVVSQ